jgi:alkylmercury lyase
MQEHKRQRSNSIVERLNRAGLRPQEDAVRKAILTAFADEGHAPSVQELVHALDLPLAPVLAACRTLAAADLIVWQDATTHIVSAYPFSGSPTAHQVLLGGHTTRYAMCAIDALGIPFMLGQGARLRSACFVCHTPVTVDIDGGLLHSASPSTLMVWLSERDGCCVAEVRCPLMNFFCEEAHLRAWHATSPQERGVSLSILEALEVGKAAFGALLT